MYKNIDDFIKKLSIHNELIKISEFVNPEYEITEITDRISKSKNGGKAILFENTGTNFPVLTNALGSDKRIAMALGKENLNELKEEINNFVKDLTSPKINFTDKISAISSLKKISRIFPVRTKKAECQDIIIKNPDLNIFPILKCWTFDGGKFITLPIVHTTDPVTGIRNVGMYRMQVFDKQTTGMHWHKHKVGARHYNGYKNLNKKIPVAVALGGDPVYTYVATAPLPDNIDEYLLAGFLRKKPVKLVKCITQPIEVPADCDIIIEGYVDTSEELTIEGPFGDHTGFYSLADYYPKFHVTCITHRKNAVYPATIVGVPPQEDAYIAKATEKIFLPLIQKSIAPEIIDMHLPETGVAHNFTIIKYKKSYEGQNLKIINSLWGAGQMSLNKFIFITDNTDIDIENYNQLAKILLIDFDPKTDLHFSAGPIDVLDHTSEKFSFGSKVGFCFSQKNKKKDSLSKNLLDFDEILKKFPEIINYNSLLKFDIPILIFSVKKTQKIKHIAEKLVKNFSFYSFKIIIFIDKFFDVNNLYNLAWICGNNIAPARDLYVLEQSDNKYILFADATQKNSEIDEFEREWPKIVTMNKKTIENINENWNNYNIGDFLSSPSLKYKEFIE